jgi:geranyl-CoA carboxylase alpha subunit
MKMEHPLKAGIDAVIKHIQVSLGDQLKNRQILLEVE